MGGRVPVAGLVLMAALAGGCALSPPSPPAAVFEEAAAAGLRREAIRAGAFTLVVWHRDLEGARRLTVYIEGDGHAWLSRRRLSPDPTPSNPIALRLAAAGPPGAVLYVSRPCQFGTVERDPACDPRYWSSHRYAPEVVAAVGAAIDWAKRRARGDAAVGLVGHSGGGALAALIAARRGDVAWLLTVASNLDTAAWTAHHGVTPLRGSLDPADDAAASAGLPQRHLVGGADDVVPAAVQAGFLRGRPGLQRLLPEHGHQCCWVRDWRRELCAFDRELALGWYPACAGRPLEPG